MKFEAREVDGRFVLEWTPPASRRKRIEFVPRPNGDWDRLVFELHESQWKAVDSEIVSELSVRMPGEEMCRAARGPRPGDGIETNRGP